MMKYQWMVSCALLLMLAGLALQPARAAGVVGNGTPQSCTELQLDAALQFGGLVTFNCGAAPLTLTVHEKPISVTTTIDGGGLVTLSGNNTNRVFSVALSVTLTLNNLSVANGYSNQFLTGGAIVNGGGTLILQHSRVIDSSCDGQCFGGAIANGGALQMFNSTISGNRTQVGSGGIANLTSGPTLIVDSTIRDNQVTNALSSGGGGLSNGRGTTVLLNSTVMSNTSLTDGGGLFNSSQGTLILVNSTLSSNAANQNGGGLKNDGVARLYNATVTNNQADADFNGSGTGGGVFNSNGATFEFRNTILAANWDTFYSPTFMTWIPHASDCYGTLNSWDYNLLQNYNTTQCFFTGATGNNLLTIPLLGPLANNGGATATHMLLPGSQAINAGNPSGCVDNNGVKLAADQRGVPRLGRCDIGAVEITAKLLLPLIVR